MKQNLNAEIVSIGTEILLGELTDTNSVYIARVLRDIGINLFFMSSVGDNEKRITDAIKLALSRADIVITCGGLGPTVDDKTRQGVAAATDRGLTFHQSLLDEIAARFASFKVEMTENNRQQAYLPDDALVVENPVGTAPAFIVEAGDKAVISLPGVPREMKFLIQEKIIPYLQDRYQLGVIKARLLKVAGIGESSLDDMIGREILENANPTVGLAAHHGEIDIRVTAKAETTAAADSLIAEMEARVRQRVGRFIYGTDGDTLQDVLVSHLIGAGQKLAVVQAGIDDALTNMLKSAERGVEVLAFERTYDHPDEIHAAFSIDQGTPLRDVASTVAASLTVEHGVDATIVLLADPDVNEGEDRDEVSVVCVYTPMAIKERVYGFGGRSDLAKAWMTRWSLSSAWRMLKGQADDQ